tara:strand:+ start:8066 stop:8188 length:123 start_codon:yes stop_codon:yes gene_type:complete
MLYLFLLNNLNLKGGMAIPIHRVASRDKKDTKKVVIKSFE